jgi:hypothetical protein
MAWGRGPATAWEGEDAEAGATAYGVVTESPTTTAPSVAPATLVVHGRRRARCRGVIAGKD